MKPYHQDKQFAVVGAGLVGSLLSVLLANRGFKVDAWERRGDPRLKEYAGGRSINLALSDRGLRALKRAGLEDEVRKLCIPMKGRMIHDEAGNLSFMPYGLEGQFINSVSRGELNKLMLEEADQHPHVALFFHQRIDEIDIQKCVVKAQDKDGKLSDHKYDMIFGTDGAFSAARLNLMKTDMLDFTYSQDYLDYGYKELSIPAMEDGGWRIEKNALHIWPRKHFMIIALPNLDGSFTVTLFLNHKGDVSFDKLQDRPSVEAFFQRYFQDIIPLIPNFVDEFFDNPTSSLVTIRCAPWQYEDKLLLMGDAAHAIVPFYGQGMNAGFEDCYVLDHLIDEFGDDWKTINSEFFRLRKPNGDAIAELALRNFIEMRDLVADPHFILKSKVSRAIAKLYPSLWQPLYTMVTFSEIPYQYALEKGNQQDEILERIVRDEPGIGELVETPQFKEKVEKYLGVRENIQ